jgi:hypothetical protein
MRAPYRNLMRFVGAGLVLVALAAAINFTVDPLQLFRRASFYTPMYSNDTRQQNAGLIRSQDFDTPFIGTSMAIHFRQRDIDRLLGVRSLKLAMTGSNSREQSFVLAAALKRAPKRVIWEMDDWIFCGAPDIDAISYFPADLYRRNAKGIAGYVLSGVTTRESLWVLARSISLLEKPLLGLVSDAAVKFSIPRVDDIFGLAPDFDVSAEYNAGKARAAFRRITDPVRSAYLAVGFDYDAMVRNFEHDAVELIAQHPDVQFQIYFPPYSILQFVALRDASPATLKIIYDFAAYASRRLLQFPNVQLHDFRPVRDITHDLRNYADVIHHSPMIDLKVLAFLAEGKYRVDRASPTAPLQRLQAQVEAYRLDNFEQSSWQLAD